MDILHALNEQPDVPLPGMLLHLAILYANERLYMQRGLQGYKKEFCGLS